MRDRYAAAGFAATLIPNGCDPDAHVHVDQAPRPDIHELPGPVAGFLGHVNDRIDLALLEAVAQTGMTLLIVGPVAPGYQADRFAALVDRPNVTWTGPRPYQEMPSYLRLIDVGLTPYAVNDFNRASFPLKTLEYLAGGRAVVATPLPANAWLGSEHIVVADGPEKFAAAVVAAAATPRTPGPTSRLGRPSPASTAGPDGPRTWLGCSGSRRMPPRRGRTGRASRASPASGSPPNGAVGRVRPGRSRARTG